MINYLILPVIVLASLLLSYVLAQDFHGHANRLFATFMAIVIVQAGFNLVRLTTRDETFAYLMSQTLGLTLALNQLILIWLILVLFLPRRYAQPIVRWLISLPYLAAIAALLPDLASGRSLWLLGVTPGPDGVFNVVTRSGFHPLLLGLILSNLAPIILLGGIAARHAERRVPALVLNAGCVLSLCLGLLPQASQIPVLYIINPTPIYLAFAWITLRYQLFRPSPIALQTAIESLPEGVAFLDHEQRVLYANRTAKEYLALVETETPPSLVDVLKQANLNETRQEASTGDLQTRYVRATASPQIIEGVEVAVLGDRRQTHILLLRDITTEEQRTITLQRALAEVETRAAEQNHLLDELSQQREIIRELSVPLLPIREDTVVLPLVGALDTTRLRQVQERALKTVEHNRTRLLILDITGVPVFDTTVAQGVMHVVQAAQLMGAAVALVGIRPEVAQAIVGLGIQLEGITTFATLQEAIAAGGR